MIMPDTQTPAMNDYRLYDGVDTWVASACSPQASLLEARSGLDYDYDLTTRPLRITITASDIATGEELDSETVYLQMDVPDCAAGRMHDWHSDLDVCGAPNGGVSSQAACPHCGCIRTTVTRHQDIADGSTWDEDYVTYTNSDRG